MPKRIIPLSDMKIQRTKAKDKSFALFDGGGLFLLGSVDIHFSQRYIAATNTKDKYDDANLS